MDKKLNKKKLDHTMLDIVIPQSVENLQLPDATLITYYKNLDDFFEKNKNGQFRFFTTKAQHKHTDVEYSDDTFLFFGKETKGLPEQLLFDNPEKCVRIPMINNSSARSLNLSNSVAIAVYEVLRQWDYPDLLCAGKLTQFNWEDAE